MANIGGNKGQTLRDAIRRFATMSIHEIRDITGLSYPKIDEKLNLSVGRSQYWADYPGINRPTGPQRMSVQTLENNVAKLLKRPAHKVIIENNKLGGINVGGIDKPPTDFKKYDWSDYQLGYADEWPTYRSLKIPDNPFEYYPTIFNLIKANSEREEWPEMLALYAWQWGVLWDKAPWLQKSVFGIFTDSDLSEFITKRYLDDTKRRHDEKDINDPVAMASVQFFRKICEIESGPIPGLDGVEFDNAEMLQTIKRVVEIYYMDFSCVLVEARKQARILNSVNSKK